MEKMTDFFINRLDGYDEHMITDVVGCKSAYAEMARLVPADSETLLDLGCGTGLELEGIFERLPDLSVTGIDLTKEMLDKLEQKYSDKNVTLINASYFDCELGVSVFDAAVSLETMHHFEPERKLELYRNIRNALKPGGLYIECDYMITDAAEQERLFAECARVRTEEGIPEGEFYHFDTPCTVEFQKKLFLDAGFASSSDVFREGNTTIIVSRR